MGEWVRVGGVWGGLNRPARTEHPEPGRPSCTSRTCVLELAWPHLLARAQTSRTCVSELVHPDRTSRTALPESVGRRRWVESVGLVWGVGVRSGV